MPLLVEQPQDHFWMAKALRYASLGLGETWPNPAVGCLMISGDDNNPQQIHLSRTAAFGRPHAEETLLTNLDSLTKGATVYVTLEPCAHEGNKISCADRLIQSGVKRVVIALRDPDPRTNGAGIQKLLSANKVVTIGCLEKQARRMQQGFLTRQLYQRPMVTLKTAISLDGKIADYQGHSQWITNKKSRRRVHLLRAFHDAVMVGIGTVMKDDPMLNCRLPRFQQRRSLRIILDRQLRIPLNSRLVQTARQNPTWVLCLQDPENRRIALEKKAVKVFLLPDMSITSILGFLGQEGLTRVLVEGGPKLHTAFLEAGLVDQLIVFRAPILLGSQGLDMTSGLSAVTIEQPPRFKLLTNRNLAGDAYEQYEQVSSCQKNIVD